MVSPIKSFFFILHTFAIILEMAQCRYSEEESQESLMSFDERLFHWIGCRGSYDPTIFVELDELAKACFLGLLHTSNKISSAVLCRKNCYSNSYFNDCMHRFIRETFDSDFEIERETKILEEKLTFIQTPQNVTVPSRNITQESQRSLDEGLYREIGCRGPYNETIFEQVDEFCRKCSIDWVRFPSYSGPELCRRNCYTNLITKRYCLGHSNFEGYYGIDTEDLERKITWMKTPETTKAEKTSSPNTSEDDEILSRGLILNRMFFYHAKV